MGAVEVKRRVAEAGANERLAGCGLTFARADIRSRTGSSASEEGRSKSW